MAPPDNSDDITRSHLHLEQHTVVGHYRIIEKIGAGGMGEVYLADDTVLQRQVALKFLPAHLCRDEDCRARFLREARAAALLDHPNIVTIYEVGEIDGRPFFAMQVVRGKSLKELLQERELSLDRIIDFAAQVCDGLSAAHERGITHRDIKPSNILIDQHGRAVIADFGLASVKGSDPLTRRGSTLGTIGYMSPEQVRGEDIDSRSDLFSLGVTIYEMITGKQPFSGDSDIATLHNITDREPEPLERYKSGIPPELQNAVSKALAKERSHRYQRAEDLATDLRGIRVGTHSRPRRSLLLPSLLGLAAVLILVIAIALVGPWMQRPSQTIVTGQTRQWVVVVPFKNLTGDTLYNALGKMVADWTTQSLLPTGLGEIVPTEKLPRRTEELSLKALVDSTGANILVAGSIYRFGDSIQFQAQVLNSDARLLQAIEPVYSSSGRIMEGVDAVRQRVLGAVALALDERLGGTSMQTSEPPTYAAYREYMEAREVGRTDLDWEKAAEGYRRAYAMDTTFLEALLRACGSYFNSYQYSRMDSLVQFLELRMDRLSTLQKLKLEEWRAQLAGDGMQALEAMRQASKIASGYTYEWGYWAFRMNRPREAIAAFKAMDPTKGSARDWRPYWVYLAACYHVLGEFDDELSVARRGRKSDSTNALLLDNEVRALAAKGKIDEIKKRFAESLSFPVRGSFDPGRIMRSAGTELRAHGFETAAMDCLNRSLTWYEALPNDRRIQKRADYAEALYLARRWSDAEKIFSQLAKDSPSDPDIKLRLALIAARQGNRPAALAIASWLEAEKGPYQFGEFTYDRACIAAVLGDKAEALVLLRKSLEEGNYFNISIHRNVDFESLWQDAAFQELIRPTG